MTGDAHDREVVFRCPSCGVEATCREDYREDLVVLCPDCGAEITREFRRAFFAGISADIHARLVEQDNREFLRYLSAGWSGGEDSQRPG